MGNETSLRQWATALVLLVGASGASAAPREPVSVTELSDPSLVPLSGTDRPNDGSLDEDLRRFSLAMTHAIEAEQRSIEQACRSRPADGAATAPRFDWQATCLYERH